jgi:hypothetical protein
MSRTMHTARRRAAEAKRHVYTHRRKIQDRRTLRVIIGHDIGGPDIGRLPEPPPNQTVQHHTNSGRTLHRTNQQQLLAPHKIKMEQCEKFQGRRVIIPLCVTATSQGPRILCLPRLF